MESDPPHLKLRRARERAGFGTAADFAARFDLPETTYRSHENGNRKLTMEAARQYAAKLGNVSWLELLGEPAPEGKLKETQSGSISQHLPNTQHGGFGNAHKNATNVSPGDMLRVLGMAEGGPDGWNLFNGETVQFITRPANLIGVTGAYGVYIRGTSMSPRYEPGEIAHIHPGKPVQPGCYVLVQRRNPEDEALPLAVIKRLVRRTATKVVLAQLDPAKEFDVPAKEIVSIHRIVGSSEG